jgi:hypothetical protein
MEPKDDSIYAMLVGARQRLFEDHQEMLKTVEDMKRYYDQAVYEDLLDRVNQEYDVIDKELEVRIGRRLSELLDL